VVGIPRYVAFLRGINSGRNQVQRMEQLRRIFEELGFRNVTTVLASGNVIFESGTADRGALEAGVERAMLEETGIGTVAIIRTREEIRSLIDRSPFGNPEIASKMKPYATFLKDPPVHTAGFPRHGQGYSVLGLSVGVVWSILDPSSARTPDLMRDLEATFGRNVTTRSWSTVLRIASRLET
jgi:uncharacterized protein (DUF1697 family)